MSESSETNAMQYTKDQTVTVMRGKTKGQRATVIDVDAENKTYAVRYENGTLGVINAVNVKAPVEATVTEGRLAAEIQTLVNDLDGADRATLQSFISRLSGDMPGLGARIVWPSGE